MDQEIDEQGVFRQNQINLKDGKKRFSVMSLQRNNFDLERDLSLSNQRSFIQVMNLQGSQISQDINEMIHFQQRRRSLMRNSNNCQSFFLLYTVEIEDQMHEVKIKYLNQKTIDHQCCCQGYCNQFHCPCFNQPLQLCIIGQCCQNCVTQKNKRMREDLNKKNFDCSCKNKKNNRCDTRSGQSHSKPSYCNCNNIKRKNNAAEKPKKKRKEKQKLDSGYFICSCRKSNCLKKYCRCFNQGKSCRKQCACQDCRNRFQQGQDIEEIKMLRQRFGRVDSQNEDIDCYFAGQDYQNNDLPRSMEFLHPNLQEAYDRN